MQKPDTTKTLLPPHSLGLWIPSLGYRVGAAAWGPSLACHLCVAGVSWSLATHLCIHHAWGCPGRPHGGLEVRLHGLPGCTYLLVAGPLQGFLLFAGIHTHRDREF